MLKLAIAGSGGMAAYQCKKFSSLPDCTITACKDHSYERAREFALQKNIPYAYDSMEKLISSGHCNALACAVVDSRHADICLDALQANYAVFCEKPMTRTLEEARQLAFEAQKTQLVTYVNFSKRNAPAVQQLHRLLQEEFFGDISSVSLQYHQGWAASLVWGDWRDQPRWKWRMKSELCTSGVVGDLGSHIIDMGLYLFGEMRIDSIVQAVSLDEAAASGVFGELDIPAEFLNQQHPVWVEIAAEGYLGTSIPFSLSISTIDIEALDTFSIHIQGTKADAYVNLGDSRTAVHITPKDPAAIRFQPADNSFQTTYEQFARLALSYTQGVAVEHSNEIPDFAHGLRVQTLLNTLSPGGLPV